MKTTTRSKNNETIVEGHKHRHVHIHVQFNIHKTFSYTYTYTSTCNKHLPEHVHVHVPIYIYICVCVSLCLLLVMFVLFVVDGELSLRSATSGETLWWSCATDVQIVRKTWRSGRTSQLVPSNVSSGQLKLKQLYQVKRMIRGIGNMLFSTYS